MYQAETGPQRNAPTRNDETQTCNCFDKAPSHAETARKTAGQNPQPLEKTSETNPLEFGRVIRTMEKTLIMQK